MEKTEIIQNNIIFWPELTNLNFPLPCISQINQEKEENKISTFEDLKSSEINNLSKKVKFISYQKNNKTSFFVLKKTKRKEEKKQNSSNGRWTKEERINFAYGLYKYGVDWKKLQKLISTRTNIQLRSHAQKFLIKLKSSQSAIIKNLNLSNLSWKQTYNALKMNLNDEEFLSLLTSIESELEDNKRMTYRYIERKNLLEKTKFFSIEQNDTSLSTSEENNSNINEENFNENKNEIYNDKYHSNFIKLDEDNIFNDNINIYEKIEKDNILYDKYINNYDQNLDVDINNTF
jgi:SHAQKYF class myb-like DNA-binding protein